MTNAPFGIFQKTRKSDLLLNRKRPRKPNMGARRGQKRPQLRCGYGIGKRLLIGRCMFGPHLT